MAAVPADAPRAILQVGLGAILVSSLLAVGLRLGGVDPLTGFIILAVAGVALAAVGLSAGRRLWRAVLGMLLMIFAPLVLFVVLDAYPFGRIAAVPVEGAAGVRSATGFRFTDGAPRTDLLLSTTVVTSGQRGPNHADFVVAPVTGPGWTAAAPVEVWVIEGGHAPPAAWSAAGGVIRLFPNGKHDEVVARAERRHGLHSAPGAVIGRWVADPGAAQGDALLAAVGIPVGAMVLWTGLVLTGRRRPVLLVPPAAPPRR